MTLIEEMRHEANVGSLHYLVDKINDWADRLARSGALVPVPYGDWVPIQEVEERSYFLDKDGDLDFVEEGAIYINPNETVQRARLVPLKEAGI